MRKKLQQLIIALLSILAINASSATAESIPEYVGRCQKELNFRNVSIPNLDCYDGDLFAPSSHAGDPVNDYMGYVRVTDQVDLTFACRWLFGDKTHRAGAISVELMIHNRENGNTCFFSAKPQSDPADFGSVDVVSNITSPTDPAAASYWHSPAEVDAKVRCVGCHISGPYLASIRIAPTLAKFGLLNNGHDTLAVLPGRYHAVGTTFSQWDSLAQKYITPSCASGCHQTAAGSSQRDILPRDIMPDFTGDEPVLLSPASLLSSFDGTGVMPPTNNEFSDYRWVNMDVPDGPGDDGESETLADLKVAYKPFYCSNPEAVEAHVVGSGIILSTNDFPDKLNRFNLQDGLVCLNADQPSGHCQNYQTRYHCNGRWTAWQDNDDPGSSGDWELRRGFKGLCASPDGIQAGYKVGKNLIFSPGPKDRLAEFDTSGLVCHNADQDNGQCSNYVVRFDCPGIRTIDLGRTTIGGAIGGAPNLP